MTTESTAPEKKKLHPDVVAKIDRIHDKQQDELQTLEPLVIIKTERCTTCNELK
jgi:hypothetical protein